MTRFLLYNVLLCKWARWADYVNHLLLTADLQCVVGYTVRPERPSIHVLGATAATIQCVTGTRTV